MREAREWDEAYILGLPAGEHSPFEAKGRRTIDLTAPGVNESAGLDMISKEVSAFANSGGGVLVLGLKENKTRWEIDDGGVALSVKGKMSTREWLEDVIPNLVESSLVSFDVYVILGGAEGSHIAEGRGIFVIDIRDSDQAPHQARDNRYYARVGGKSRPIGHRLVMDIVNRRRHPKMELDVEFYVTRRRKLSSNEILGINQPLYSLNRGQLPEPEYEEIVQLDLSAWNSGKVLVNFMQCYVWIPKALALSGLHDEEESNRIEEIDGIEYVVWGESNTERDITGYSQVGLNSSPEYGPSWYKRILPGLAHSWDWELGPKANDLLKSYSDIFIHWEIYADNAPVEKGKVQIGEIKVNYKDESKRRGG